LDRITNNQTQQESGWNKELLYQLIENVKEYAIFVSDLEERIVSWNIGAEKIFGYTAEEIIGQHNRILFTPEDRANNVPEKELETACKEGCAEDERWHVRKDGSFFFASGMHISLYDETGNLTGYAKIARDLTERINFQEQLQKAEDNLETKVRERTSELSGSNEELR
jgi:PAS domain S-box-containing protein